MKKSKRKRVNSLLPGLSSCSSPLEFNESLTGHSEPESEESFEARKKRHRDIALEVAKRFPRLCLILMIILSVGCKKNTYPDPGRATFYTFSSHQMNLIVDGERMGTIEHAPAFQVPVCGDTHYQVLVLSAGEHRIHATENNDTLWVSDKIIYIPENGCIQVQLP